MTDLTPPTPPELTVHRTAEPRPDGCCGTCPPIRGGGYDCTCADNPRCNANHADRYDRHADLWVWCDECDGFRVSHKGPSYGWTAAEIDERYGPLTFAPRPAEPPATAPQPAQAHGDADEPDRPELNVQTALADAWDEGHAAGCDDPYARWGECGCGPNPYRQDRA